MAPSSAPGPHEDTLHLEKLGYTSQFRRDMSPWANFALGLKRAMTVRNILVAAGLDRASIDATSDGELDLLVRTPDETPEPRNRRVVITVR